MTTETDRELLKFAAKAAGFSDATWAAEQACILTLEQKQGFKLFWNPLTNDGDALRLAVKLQMEVAIFKDECHTRCIEHGQHGWIDEAGESCASTRRAIVRAAAEIGKGME